ncbi:MAG: SLC13 family permease [Bacteroidales bacterium]|nr:SLC13 family permease [Bacteroidales bacterium]
MYFTATVLVLMTICLVIELTKPSFILSASVLLLYFFDIISLEEGIAGFSNEGMLTIAVLFVVTYALQSSSAFNYAIQFILKRKSSSFLYARLIFPVAIMSAFLNNIPVVASLVPVLKRWSLRNNFPVSKLLIPISYAAIAGGMCTLIGTSTNLIVHGLLIENGYDGFAFFELGKVGVPLVIVTVIYYTFLGKGLLPVRKDSLTNFTESSREFVVEVRITDDYPYIGKTIEQAHLRHLRGLFLFQITRCQETLAPVSPQEKIELNDRLFFTGLPDTILDLLQTPGFQLIKDVQVDLQNIDSEKYKTFEAVISNSSPLAGKTVRDSGFRAKYDAVILAIHRNGHRLNKKVGDIVFQPSDTLFLLSKKEFEGKWYHSTDFSLVSSKTIQYSRPKVKGNLALLLLLVMIGLVVANVISLLVAAVLTAGVMIAGGIVSTRDAKKAINFDALLVIVAALGIGNAVVNSGLANWIGMFMVEHLSEYGVFAILIGLFFLTSIYTELITNNAAAVLMFPIAITVSQQLQVDMHVFAILIAIAASSSFMTPIGYQTNLIVYGAGGYKFIDFVRNGLLLSVCIGLLTCVILYWYFL